jgi:predicted O-methyltransferase YrrM
MLKTCLRKLVKFLSSKPPATNQYSNSICNNILSDALSANYSKHSDISDHLNSIFFFALISNPKLIVELGTRGGESTKALLAACKVSQSKMLSIDINDCSPISLPHREHWAFEQADDIEFGKKHFEMWCKDNNVAPVIDTLFIDTSHEYEHTKDEISTWSKYLRSGSIMLFHDTNMGQGAYARNDGTIGYGWNNNRGVIRALEDLMGNHYPENSYFCDATGEYRLLHYPNCNGLTILVKT